MSNSPSQPLLPADARAPETRSAWRGILNLLTAERATFVNIATLNRRNAVLTADVLIRRLAESEPTFFNQDGSRACTYCNIDLDQRKPVHAPGCLWQDANDFTAQDKL